MRSKNTLYERSSLKFKCRFQIFEYTRGSLIERICAIFGRIALLSSLQLHFKEYFTTNLCISASSVRCFLFAVLFIKPFRLSLEVSWYFKQHFVVWVLAQLFISKVQVNGRRTNKSKKFTHWWPTVFLAFDILEMGNSRSETSGNSAISTVFFEYWILPWPLFIIFPLFVENFNNLPLRNPMSPSKECWLRVRHERA